MNRRVATGDRQHLALDVVKRNGCQVEVFHHLAADQFQRPPIPRPQRRTRRHPQEVGQLHHLLGRVTSHFLAALVEVNPPADRQRHPDQQRETDDQFALNAQPPRNALTRRGSRRVLGRRVDGFTGM